MEHFYFIIRAIRDWSTHPKDTSDATYEDNYMCRHYRIHRQHPDSNLHQTRLSLYGTNGHDENMEIRLPEDYDCVYIMNHQGKTIETLIDMRTE